MNRFTRISTTFLLSLALTACGGDTTEPTGDSATADIHVHGADCEHDAEAVGPHGGALAAVGTSAARLEALHDDVLGQVTVYVLDTEGAMLTLDQPPVLNMVTDEGSAQLKPTQIGGAWVFESDDLLDEPQKARFRIALAGKSWTVDMPCSHEHDAEHGAEHEGDEHVEVDHDHATHDDHGHEKGDDDDEHGSHEGGHDDD
jgi:catabolite regulation protein CreA